MQAVLVVNDLKDVDNVGFEDHARHDDLVQYVVHLGGRGGKRRGKVRNVHSRVNLSALYKGLEGKEAGK